MTTAGVIAKLPAVVEMVGFPPFEPVMVMLRVEEAVWRTLNCVVELVSPSTPPV
jgi:hypothetical protein